MANFLGAGFAFGARDVGLKAATDSATKNLDTINDLLDEQDKKGGLLGKMWKGMGERVKQFNIASIASNMRSLTGETGNLSNSLESMGVSYAQASKPIIHSMNVTGKEAQKMTGRVTSMAIALNTGATEVAETFKAIHGAGKPAKAAIDAMGMSEKDWVKVTQTTGVTMQDFAGLMGDMVASWGASPKQAGLMVDNLTAIGKAANIGTQAVKNAKGQLDALDAIFEQLPPSMARTADEVQNLMESTYKLAGAFREMEETEEQATQLGQDTAKMFAEQAVMIEKLYKIGGEGALDESPLFKFLTMLGTGTEEARDIIREGSVDVVKGVTRINDIFAKMGGDASPQVQYALGELNKAMGQSAAGLGWLASNLDTGTKSLAAMNAMAVKGEGALKKYGQQAFSTGRNLQEQFDLAKERLDTQIRGIGRKDVKRLVREQMGAFRDVGKELRNLGSDDTWGPLVKAISGFKQMGATGLFLSLAETMGLSAKGMSKVFVKFRLAFDVLKDVGDSLAPMMQMLGMFGPLGLAAGGIIGFFMLDTEDRKKIMQKLSPLWKDIVKVWHNNIWPAIAEGSKKIWSYITTKIPWSDIGDKYVWPALSFLGEKVWDGLKWAWTKVGEELGPGGQLAIGSIILGQAGGGGLLGAAGMFSAAIASAFGPAGIAGMALLGTAGAVAAIIANAHKVRKAEAQRFDIPRTKKAARMIGRGQAQIGLRRKTFGAMSIDEIGRGIESGILKQRDVDRMLKQEDFASRMGGDAELNTKLRAIMAISAAAKGGDTSRKGIDRAFLEFESKFAIIQKLPEVQMELERAFVSKDVGVIANRLSVISDAYRGSIADLSKLAMEAEDTRGKVESALLGVEAGKYGGEKTAEDEIAINLLSERVKAAYQKAESEALAAMGANFDYARFGGMNIIGQLAAGIEEGEPSLAKGMGVTLDKGVKSQLPSSAPKEGPLEGDFLPNAGTKMIQMIGDGIVLGSEEFTNLFSGVLEDSAYYALEAYDAKVKEWSDKKTLLKSVAAQMVRDFGGELSFGTIETDTVDLNAKETFEAALSIPGLAGVIAAITTDGHQTRVLLNKIREDTHNIAESDIIKKGFGAGDTRANPVLAAT